MATFAFTGQKSPLAQGNLAAGFPVAVPNGGIRFSPTRATLGTFNSSTDVVSAWASGVNAFPVQPLPGGGGSGDNPVGVPIDCG